MQVFISDVHLTDGSSGETIKLGAFELLRDNLKVLVGSIKGGVTELQLVLLGDIFDVIRSQKWLEDKVRPWSRRGLPQENKVKEIVSGIISQNKDVLDCVRTLGETLGLHDKFSVQYVIGNHDWLINRYPDVRKMVAEALGMPAAAAVTTPFPTELFNADYKTTARHGDIYDDSNYMEKRDQSSLGDAIVIELLNKFPVIAGEKLDALGDKISPAEKAAVVNKLKEIDNVRPLLDVPAWVLMIISNISNDAVKDAIESAWEQCVDQFFEINFIKKMDTWLWPDKIDQLQIALQLSSHLSKRILDGLVDFYRKFKNEASGGGYLEHACEEAKISSREAQYVIYGHTHDYLMIPIDQVLSSASDGDSGLLNLIYFNTGTWRQTWNKTARAYFPIEFIGWNVLTYIAFYNRKENGQYNFEVWNGALG